MSLLSWGNGFGGEVTTPQLWFGRGPWMQLHTADLRDKMMSGGEVGGTVPRQKVRKVQRLGVPDSS